MEDDGNSPVEDFLASLDPKAQRRFRWSIEQLRVRNVTAREPLARHLEGKVWELREESQTNIYRLLYAFVTGRQILFLHGFQKKTQKTPRGEIETTQPHYPQDAFHPRVGVASAFPPLGGVMVNPEWGGYRTS